MNPPVYLGLAGGLGNCLFCLPAIKALARAGPVYAVVRGDYPQMFHLFGRCAYFQRLLHAEGQILRGARLICGQYPPDGRRPWKILGWPPGESRYPHPEWQQIKQGAVGDGQREDVADWVRGLIREPRFDVGLVPGCKPGELWARKRYPQMLALARRLEEMGQTVTAFGQAEEIDGAGLRPYWQGPVALRDLPERLAQARMVIGTDSGVTQLASSIGVPCVMLFTATSAMKGDPVGPPAINRKLSLGLPCSPCQSTPRWKQCTDWRCREITVEQVLAAAEELRSPSRLPVIR